MTLARLRSYDIRDVIVNVHHFADLVVGYLKAHHDFGMNIRISREEILLDTGGGLKKAAWFFDDQAEPFVLHNVDVISTIDLHEMAQFHKDSGALATLAVMQRPTSRPLLFDEQLLLAGRGAGQDGKAEIVRPSAQTMALAFSGIHVISPRLLRSMRHDGVFSIIATYLDLASQGERIAGFRTDQYYWRDLGKPENIQQAAEDLRNGLSLVR
jgi:NDP-sugar pyrophosphorylase family protein